MATVNLKARSGNKITVLYDGKMMGAVRSVTGSDDYSPEPVLGIGEIHVQEYVPTVARHTLAINGMVLIADNLRKAGIYAENGDDALKGNVFDILVQAKDDGAVLRKYSGCSYASGSVEVTSNAIVMNSGSMMALDVTGKGA